MPVVSDGILGGRGGLGGVSLNEGDGVGGGCEDSQALCHDLSAGGFFWTCNVTTVGVELPSLGRYWGWSLNGHCRVGSCWELNYEVS